VAPLIMTIIILSALLLWPSNIQEAAVNPAPPSRQEDKTPHPPSPSDISQLRAKADAGDANAENALGVMSRLGEGVEKDKQEAVRWFRRAAKHGNATGMFNLAAAYYNGDGVGVDDVSSCAWFLLSQEAGYSQADDAVRRAASENPSRITEASVKVAEMYETGEDLPKNIEKALKWYRKAAEGGAPAASVSVAGLLLNGRTPSQEESVEARTRCEDAARLKYAPGAYCMAVIYRRGLGVPQDPVETAKWLTRAAELGHPKAVLQLGEAYWKGEGVAPDPTAAYMWIWMAYSAKVAGAEQDEQALRQEMHAKDIEKARKKANDWVVQHRFVSLRHPPSDGSPPPNDRSRTDFQHSWTRQSRSARAVRPPKPSSSSTLSRRIIRNCLRSTPPRI